MKSNPIRCPWPTDELYLRYHDEEWGGPVHDDRRLFEFSMVNDHLLGCFRHAKLK
jgi:DNA-3-methyladenine glycosylase I